MKNNVPKLRFPEFSGEWKRKKIIDAADYVDYRGKTPEKVDNGIFLVTAKNVKMGYIDYEISKEYISMADYSDVMRRGIPQIGDVIITTEAPLGNVACVDRENIALAQRVIKYRGKNKILNNYFLKNVFLSDHFQKKLDELSTGGTAKGIKGSLLHEINITIPILIDEQTKIADFLNSIDDKIQQLTKKKELLEQYKKGVTQQIFSQQIRFKDDNGNNYPNWQEKDLKEIAEVNPKSENVPNNFYYVDLESVNNGRVGTLNYINSNDAPSRAQRVLSKNDILFQMVRPYQRNNLLFSVTSEDNYVASTGYAQLRVRENYDYKFIFQMLLTENFVNTVMLRCTGTSYPAINSSDLSTITINIPKYEEQVKIADFLTGLDNKINQVNKQIEQTKLFKKSLLQLLFI